MDTFLQDNTSYDEILEMIEKGEFQSELAKWYLAFIESEVMNYLIQHGYDKSGESNNYTHQRPSNIQSVQNNYNLLNRLLSKENEEVLTNELIKPLTNIIYPKITDVLTMFRLILKFVELQEKKNHTHHVGMNITYLLIC